MTADFVSGSRFGTTPPLDTPANAAPAVATAPPTLYAFMAQALAMELEAVERYTEFADAMETHNNLEVASMFRTMAGPKHPPCHRRRRPGLALTPRRQHPSMRCIT